jgi:hypothetical protein
VSTTLSNRPFTRQPSQQSVNPVNNPVKPPVYPPTLSAECHLSVNNPVKPAVYPPTLSAECHLNVNNPVSRGSTLSITLSAECHLNVNNLVDAVVRRRSLPSTVDPHGKMATHRGNVPSRNDRVYDTLLTGS